MRELLDREAGLQSGSHDAIQASLVRRLKQSSTLSPQHMHNAPVNAVSWSPDGTLLLSGSEDAVVKLWDLSRSRQQPVKSFDTGEHLGTAIRLPGCSEDPGGPELHAAALAVLQHRELAAARKHWPPPGDAGVHLGIPRLSR